MQKKKILMIDDDPDFIYIHKVYLEKRGYEVLTAYNGEEGIKIAKEVKPNVIVLDVMMTKMTEGFDVSRKLKSNDELREIPVIMLTGIRKKEKLPWTFEPDEGWLPISKFLEKPILPEKLFAEIEQITK